VAFGSLRDLGRAVAFGRARSARRKRLLDVADLVIDICTPPADAMVSIDGWTAVAPGSTIGSVAIVNAIKSRTAELLVARGAMPP